MSCAIQNDFYVLQWCSAGHNVSPMTCGGMVRFGGSRTDGTAATTETMKYGRMSLDEMPLEILELVVDTLEAEDLVALAKTCRAFRYLCNKKIYNQIIIGNKGTQNDYTHLDEARLPQFVAGLNGYNSGFINKLVTFVDDAQLYSRLQQFDVQMDLRPYSSSFTNYHYFVQKSWFKKKFSSLNNWLIVNEHDLASVPYNANLRHLKLFLPNTLASVDSAIFGTHSNLSLNLQNVTSLNLSTPRATMVFSNYHGPMNNLTNLSICNHHNFNPDSKLDFQNFQNVDWSKLKNLELKFACNCDCDCIYQFISQLPPMNLERFALINYKSCTDSRNIYQFQQIFKLLGKFTSKLTYININEFGTNQFDWKLLTNIRTQQLIIPDFFNTYKFSMNFNQCDCCEDIRNKFNSLAMEDAENNYIHKFSDKKSAPSNKIIQNQITKRFFNYIISQSKNQYKCFNQGIFKTTSIFDFEDLPIDYDDSLSQWKTLIEHTLTEVIGTLKQDKALNLSGFNFDA
jgi:hypothetical protein